MFEFHISRLARDRYEFDLALFGVTGTAILANFHAARVFAQKMNAKRDLLSFPEQAVKAGQINALGLIDELLHILIAQYRKQRNPQVMSQGLSWLEERLGAPEVDRLLREFLSEFPPLAVYTGKVSIDDYLNESTDGYTHRAVAIEELILLWVTNQNPAASVFSELFDDRRLSSDTAYSKVFAILPEFFATQPKFGPQQQNLLDLLQAPAKANPHSLAAQLEFIRTMWTELLGSFLYRLLSSLDLLKEEEKPSFTGPGPALAPRFDVTHGIGGAENGDSGEVERFSEDREWMPRLVLIAKNSYVWLDQLSRKYQRSITHLDQIPDEELDQLARWGITGLWLIGLWQRSDASARIKQLCGNPEAIASAYSLADYRIADDLGGDSAYANLRDRAWQRGIRLASDMVPNHMGIDSSWVIQHPDWFLGVDYSPFPSYTFDGPDLSPDPSIGIQLEDHYYTRTDAAVVFKREDRRTGSVRYIYHGNDGTSMPWNDTAQLDYLKAEVREAVIQTILSVARKFPIIRFDAAMTLAKKHIQRLWFPEPGTGGAIASRADHGLTRDAFNALLPQEFWREVVDRVAAEVPDTLLLAEAFWLMEGYFVRTLGMHRVYNSAFMHMLRNEDNAGYRTLIKSTLEFDPEILKRYVNFMNNPDEKTAVDQFGKGGKYFGICVLMSTLPGLPMFGHGQVEGYAEKYGMEFRRAYWDEQVDDYLVQRHEREVFPLLHQRRIFAGVEQFWLYDFQTPDGHVDENVYAYTNGYGDQKALVIFHNKFASTHGTIRWSVSQMDKRTRAMVQHSLTDELSIPNRSTDYLIFRDQTTNLEFIRACSQIHDAGFDITLQAYEYHVFTDFRVVSDDANHTYERICAHLQGRGVPSVVEAVKELTLQPIQQPFEQIANAGYFSHLMQSRSGADGKAPSPAVINEAEQKYRAVLVGIQSLGFSLHNADDAIKTLRSQLEWTLRLPGLAQALPVPASSRYEAALKDLVTPLADGYRPWLVLFGYIFTSGLGKLVNPEDPTNQTQTLMEEWQLRAALHRAYQNLGMEEGSAQAISQMQVLMSGLHGWMTLTSGQSTAQRLQKWMSTPEIQAFLGVNRYKDILWYSKEQWQQFLDILLQVAALDEFGSPDFTASHFVESMLQAHAVVMALRSAGAASDYQVEKLLHAIAQPDKREK